MSRKTAVFLIATVSLAVPLQGARRGDRPEIRPPENAQTGLIGESLITGRATTGAGF